MDSMFWKTASENTMFNIEFLSAVEICSFLFGLEQQQQQQQQQQQRKHQQQHAQEIDAFFTAKYKKEKKNCIRSTFN